MRFRFGVLFLLNCYLSFLSISDALAETSANHSIRADHVEIRLLEDPRPHADQIRLGLHFQLENEWHIYWRNPGDSGAAPKIVVTGGSLGQIFWPSPKRIPFGELTNFGYEREVVLPFLVQWDPDSKEMTLDLEWLVCKVECIPGFGQFKVKRPLEAEAGSPKEEVQRLFDDALLKVPTDQGPWQVTSAKLEGQSLSFDLRRGDGLLLAKITKLDVFPHDGRFFKTNPPKIEVQGDKLALRMLTNFQDPAELQSPEITLVAEVEGRKEAQEFRVSLMQTPSNLWLILLFAFFGGVLLNLMPCVFPVLFLKVYGFIKAFEKSNIAAVRRSAWGYSSGVIFTFLTLGGLLYFLRATGVAVGWGFQLQQPVFVYILYLLFLMMALTFLGLLRFGDIVASSAGRNSGSKVWGSDFGSGILSVLVASPCTAPFMGAALGSAMTLPAWGTAAVFVALGFGLALPVLLIAHSPVLANSLPKPGPWMLLAQRTMAFPMLGTSLWLLWILGQQTNIDYVVLCLAVGLTASFFIWLRALVKGPKWLALVFSFAAFGVVILPLVSVPDSNIARESADWKPYSDALIEEQRGHRPVFIDFTAAWCITCQVNKRTVLTRESVLALFRSKNVLLVQADWTDHSPHITKALENYGRNSVPLYVYIDADGNSKILPEILTESIVSDVLNANRPKEDRP